MNSNLDLGTIAADHIDAIGDIVRGIKPTRELVSLSFKFSELTVEGKCSVLDRLSDTCDERCVSIYSIHLDATANRLEFLHKFENAKTLRLGGLAYPRLNRPPPELSDDCLYVGTSRKTHKRLAEHLGYGNDKTYALHLGKWTDALVGGIEIGVNEYDLSYDHRGHLTHLEDALARDLRPMLGRRGNL